MYGHNVVIRPEPKPPDAVENHLKELVNLCKNLGELLNLNVENITENYIENIVSAVEAESEVHDEVSSEVHDEVSSDFEFFKTR